MSKIPGPAVISIPIQVEVTGSFEYALSKFKKLVQTEKIIGQVKDRMEYKKPSLKKRMKRREALDRRLLQEMREKQVESGEWDKRKRQKAKKKAEKIESKVKKQEKSDY